MSIISFDIHLDQSATNSLEFRWSGSDELPADFTGCSAFLHVRQPKMSPEILIQLTTENGGIVFDGSSIFVTFKPAETESEFWTRAYYDLLLVYPDGVRLRFAEGRVYVSRSVTRGVN